MGISVGIDLGTTNSAVAWINPKTNKPEIVLNSEDSPITPSVIRFLDNGSIVCGEDAKKDFEMAEVGCVCAFKRKMGKEDICISFNGKNYTARDLSAVLLKHLKEETEDTLGQTITEAVITVPAYFTNAEREDTFRAAQMAGLKVRRIINEPTAAALFYSLDHWRENAIIMVYDLGGGTFDVSLAGMAKDGGMEVLETMGDHQLGGKDWDAVLVNMVVDRIYEETMVDVRSDPEVMGMLVGNAETWKKALSRSIGRVDAKVYVPEYGDTCVVTITRKEFDQATKSLMEQTMSYCNEVLKRKSLTWRNVTDVLLVGGSTRMPQVSEYIEKTTGHKPLTHTNPDAAVALGAAIQLMLPDEEYEICTLSTNPKEKRGGIAQKQDDSVLRRFNGPVGKIEENDLLSIRKRDVQPHGMGVISVNAEGTFYINENIIPPSSRIPIKAARAFSYYTSPNEDNEVEIYVLEGTDVPLRCEIRDKYVASGIRHVANGPAAIRVQYSFDRNGIIRVQVRQGNENRDLPLRREPIDYAEMKKFGEPIPVEDRVQGGQRRTVVLAVDVSGSMYSKGEDGMTAIESAKKAMCEFAEKCRGTGTRVGALCVSDRTQWTIHPTDNIDACVKAIRNIECCCTGVCNDAHPFDDILRELTGEKGERFAIVMADGIWSNQSRAIERAQECHRKGIGIAAIGFGSADTKFLNAISSQKDFAIMTTQTQLSHSFGKIAQSIGTGNAKSGKDNDTSIAKTWETND